LDLGIEAPLAGRFDRRAIKLVVSAGLVDLDVLRRTVDTHQDQQDHRAFMALADGLWRITRLDPAVVAEILASADVGGRSGWRRRGRRRRSDRILRHL